MKIFFLSFLFFFFVVQVFVDQRIYDNQYRWQGTIKEDGRIYDNQYRWQGNIEGGRYERKNNKGGR